MTAAGFALAGRGLAEAQARARIARFIEDRRIQLPSKFELTLNVRMAKAFGILVPPSRLVRTDRLLQ